MAFDEYKVKVLTGLFSLAGNFISEQISPSSDEEERELIDDYYTKAREISARRAQRYPSQTEEEIMDEQQELAHDLLEATKDQRERLDRANEPKSFGGLSQPLDIDPYKPSDMVKPKIEGGTSCLACSRDHFSTASAMLNEAIRFTKDRPMYDDEIQWRIGVALDEVNALERGDLHNDNVQPLQGKEREIAEEALGNLRELRHQITGIQNVEDLKQTAKFASDVKNTFMKKIFILSQADGTTNKLCNNLTGEERQKCIEKINTILDNKINQNN